MNFKLEMLNTQLTYHAKIKHTEMHSKFNLKDTLNNSRTSLRIYKEELSSMQLT